MNRWMLITIMILLLFTCRIHGQVPKRAEENASIDIAAANNAPQTKREDCEVFVRACLNDPVDVRLRKYREKMQAAKTKSSGEKGDPVHFPFLRELALQNDFGALEILEKETKSVTEKMAIWRAARMGGTEDMKRLLEKWAIENPEVPVLMNYHPNAATLLIQKAEDQSAIIADRIRCIRFLADMGATNVLQRLRALTNDTTEVLEPSSKLGQSVETIGSVAAKAIQVIEKSKP